MAYSLADRGAPCPLDPPVILEEALGLLRSTMDPRIQVRTEVVGSCLQVRMDPGHFRQIVLNLVFNARDAMPAGGVLTLRLTCLRLDDHLNHGFPKAKSGTFIVLTVQDSGIGMDPETQARAFDPFFTTKEVGKGAGLGLSSVLGLVKLYGGWIHLASQPGTGTTVRVYLPAIAQESLEPSAESAEQPQPGFPGQRRILLVDDEVFIRDVAREILESKGFKVTEAADGEEALARFLETPLAFDLVVLDLVMPRMHGFQVMDRIRQVAPRIPILISSGYSPDTRPDLLQASPFIGFLAKPYRTRELLEQVQRLLSEQESEL
jgi:CheY-like chemotaxis protein